jgi:hypothetical protein
MILNNFSMHLHLFNKINIQIIMTYHMKWESLQIINITQIINHSNNNIKIIYNMNNKEHIKILTQEVQIDTKI